MKHELTLKQENFCQVYIESGNASGAYRHAYDARRMKAETIHRKARELMEHGKVTARISELQAKHRQRHDITVERITAMYLEDRQIAHDLGQSGPAVSATTGLARLFGLDKQVHHVKNTDIEEMTRDELMAELDEMKKTLRDDDK